MSSSRLEIVGGFLSVWPPRSRERILTSSAFVQDEWSYEAPSLRHIVGLWVKSTNHSASANPRVPQSRRKS
ncbi:hypothetical protein M0657_007499 [Pyricularia oryzae]|uniref:Uncharacterized protein n=1 Tax=Pyricularia oryzae TaxID=318829 RepID=A0A4V1C7P4_PYROR|nr:hypothetical protein M0657_007499 [Pyricularia oryzae]KAI7926159.1 hypothetical protein M9X92_002904 [Pyricularia oryzae]QBZ64098.1 hypothetical protein PoMZ_05790 [Pyricularia oryzae]